MTFRSVAAFAALCCCATPVLAQQDTTAHTDSTHAARHMTRSHRTMRGRMASSGSTAGMSHVEFLALQQQLRDDGCGLQHVTGRMDAATRRAIAQCKTKYNVTGDTQALVDAMKIGFSSGDTQPSMSEARSGSATSMGNEMNGSMGTSSRMNSSMRGRRGMRNRNGMRNSATDSTGTMNNGTMNNGTMNNGTTNTGTPTTDSTKKDSTNSGTMNNGTPMTTPTTPSPTTPASSTPASTPGSTTP